MKNKMLVGGTILMLAATAALGTDNTNDDQGLRHDRGDLYRANELSLDVFGTASLGKYSLDHISNDRVRHNTRLGAGLGLSYFITRNIGLGADVYSEDTKGVFVDSASANLLLRFPVGQSGFAPYALGGGGYQFDLNKVWFCQFGGGFEYRFNPNIGAFLDARWVFPEETKYYGVARVGVRFAF